MVLGLLIFGVAVWVAVAAWPTRSKRVPDNVIQFVPRSSPPRATVESAGRVIDFTIEKGKR